MRKYGQQVAQTTKALAFRIKSEPKLLYSSICASIFLSVFSLYIIFDSSNDAQLTRPDTSSITEGTVSLTISTKQAEINSHENQFLICEILGNTIAEMAASLTNELAECNSKTCESDDLLYELLVSAIESEPGCKAYALNIMSNTLPPNVDIEDFYAFAKTNHELKQNFEEWKDNLVFAKSFSDKIFATILIDQDYLDNSKSQFQGKNVYEYHEKVIGELVKEAPANALVHHRVLDYCFNDPESSVCEQLENISQYVTDTDSAIGLASLLFDQGKTDQALKMLEQAMTNNNSTTLTAQYMKELDKTLRVNDSDINTLHVAKYIEVISEIPNSGIEERQILCSTKVDSINIGKEYCLPLAQKGMRSQDMFDTINSSVMYQTIIDSSDPAARIELEKEFAHLSEKNLGRVKSVTQNKPSLLKLYSNPLVSDEKWQDFGDASASDGYLNALSSLFEE